MKNTKKFNVQTCTWEHHLEGRGWAWVCSHIEKHFHSPKSKIRMYTAYEYQVRDKIFAPHLAWFHQVIKGPERCLANIVKSAFWENNTQYLLHGLTVSQYQEDFLRKQGFDRVTTIYHPTPLDVPKWQGSNFTKSKGIYHIGFHCRNINFFVKLADSANNFFSYNYLVPKETLDNPVMPERVNVIPRVNPDEYERILGSSVVFMNLSDSTANNTILECIARGTPVLVNPIGGIKEYLGKDYPLYYNSLNQAKALIDSLAKTRRLVSAHDYLIKIRQKYSIENFINRLSSVLEKINDEI